MNLILEIVGPNGHSLGPARRKVFGQEGGRIGRAPDCDWMLANPYISRHHATVRWIGGTYYIESTGENGVAINTPQAMIPQRERRPLRDGDRLYVDEYEICVSIGAGGADIPAAGGLTGFAPSDDPLAGLVATARSPAMPNPLDPSHDELDPLIQLAGGAQHRPQAAPLDVNWNHTPAVRDQFTPPAVPQVPRESIPDRWDQTSFSPPKPPDPGPAVIPDRWDETSFNPPVPPVAAPAIPVPGGARGRFAPLPLRPAAVSQPQHPPVGQQPPPRPAVGALDATALLQAAGIDPASVPPETAASLGLILRTVVEGVRELLLARAEVKSQFRVTMTQVHTEENNPLKFAPSVEDALHLLFGRRSAAYLPPVEAFEDALDDIRFHQMAMLAGMRAGFEQTLLRFEPQRLQEMFDKRGKRSGLLAAKPRYWELYVEEFRQLTGDPDDAFKRLFGEVFAVAYERQLQELKHGRGKPPR
jgi:type VI secretion system protein ImpI